MNKVELVDHIAKTANLTKAAATRALDAVITAVTKALKTGDTVTLVGFGTFKVNQRAARKGRNPQTGETISIKAKKVPAFKAGATLKAVVAGKGGKKSN